MGGLVSMVANAPWSCIKEGASGAATDRGARHLGESASGRGSTCPATARGIGNLLRRPMPDDPDVQRRALEMPSQHAGPRQLREMASRYPCGFLMPGRKGDASGCGFPDPESIQHAHAHDDLVPAAECRPSVCLHGRRSTLDHAERYHIAQHRDADDQCRQEAHGNERFGQDAHTGNGVSTASNQASLRARGWRLSCHSAFDAAARSG